MWITVHKKNCFTKNHVNATECAKDDRSILYSYRNGDEIIAPFAYKEENYVRNIGCLLALAVGFRFIGYLVLAYKFRKANR